MAIPQIDMTPVDDRSEKSIKTLLPEVQIFARSLTHAADKIGITIKVISVYSHLRATKCTLSPGPKAFKEAANAARKKAGMDPINAVENKRKVTNAKGSQSNHNFEIAFDIGVFDGKNYLDRSPLYKAVAVLGKQLGLAWGGDWKSNKDEPHYELRPAWSKDLSEADMLAELRIRKESGKAVFA